jgi:hypothetical protein
VAPLSRVRTHLSSVERPSLAKEDARSRLHKRVSGSVPEFAT